MRRNESFDLFKTASGSKTSGFSRQEADAVVMRARNAALQKPLNHLDSQRSRLAKDNVDLFAEINPMQVAQQFLALVGEHMLEDGLEVDEAEQHLASFISLFKVSSRLTDEEALTGARKVIGIIRNGYDDSSKFTEFYHDPHTGERHEFQFQLVVRKQRHDSTDIYRLTADGAKLLLLNWSAPPDVDVIGLLVTQAFRTGQYGVALSHIERIKISAIEISAKLADIESDLRRLSYDKGFNEEIKDLIQRVDAEIKKYEEVYEQFKVASDWAHDNQVANSEERKTLREANRKLEEMFAISGRLKMQVRQIFKDYRALQARLLAEVGLVTHLHDIPVDFLQRLVTAPMRKLEQEKFSEVLFDALAPIQMEKMFDPFAFLERIKIDGKDEGEPGEEDQSPVAIVMDEVGYTFGELRTAHTMIQDFLMSHPDGVRLSELAEAIMGQPTITERVRQCAMHRAVLFSPDDEWIVIKTPTGDWIDNEFFESADHVIRIVPRLKKVAA